jgi:serine/threonine-protein kinase RsbT
MVDPVQAKIASRSDVEMVRRDTRALATAIGLGHQDAERVALAVTELATNLVRYAYDGEIVVTALADDTQVGIEIESHDTGPGIDDLEHAMQNGFSTSGGFGSGLPAVRRLMDSFEIETSPDGTIVRARKWAMAADR